MKLKKYILYILILAFTGCNDSFLDYTPKTSLTEKTAFLSYNNFKTYAWGLYGIFTDPSMRQYIGHTQGVSSPPKGDVYANYLYYSSGTDVQNNVWQWNTISSTTNTDDTWDFAYIRKVNIMLQNIDGSEMSEKEKEHWRSVGLFFRSYRYFELLARYSDVPWIENVLSDEDTDILYGPRTSRDKVAANILRDLKYAEENIYVDGEGAGSNTINQNTVRALMSRFCLFEGTWRKYHSLGNSETYLNECERVSKNLIDSYPTIAANYVEVWTSDDLSKVPGMILYKELAADLEMSTFPRAERGGGHKAAMHARTVGRYLCQDGKPISTSLMYEGAGAAATVNDEFKNRDHRLYWRCVPPYKTNKGNGVAVTAENKDSWWTEGMDPKDRYYIDYMNSINDQFHQFPLHTWQPQFLSRIPMIQTSSNSWGPMRNYGGYYLYMYYSTYNESAIQAGGRFAVTDCPIFHIEEIMLNYAEVEYELGKFSQGVADLTINKLRQRANVANMVVGEINDAFDPDRDPQVEAMVWEIRRERMVELMGEGFGFYDIRRWNRAEYFMNQRPLGVRVAEAEKSDYFGNASKFVTASDIDPDASVNADDVGRVVCVGDFVKQGKGWQNHYNLNPIPKTQLILNEALEQNSGWE
ncbi:RagB/SusD family nutrient uptake outer membrane protein [Prolixibacteraceae bacterium Z1-6]|uniref:RagB/SusD family nutrient uptake outer membrane protein n=1 Tax=Draconibacterium aestuarii TaxID=2998507 RepID=A0A9X3F2V4_9BACT|nr:RagB/SusD family nutrient uptake outer membrane protein [Prolixibacteraceae bacterium Z1-6]